MTKIAFISTMEGASWGGSEELWSQTALRLLKEEVSVAASVKWWPAPNSRITEIERAGCQVHRRPIASRAQRLLRQIDPERTFRWLDKFSPDIVVISQGYQFGDVEWMRACARRGVPYVIVTHGAGEPYWPGDEELSEARKSFEEARCSYFVSQGNLNLVRKQLAFPLTNARIIRSPFNVPYESQVAWPSDQSIFKVACIGTLQPHIKGQDILFQVLREKKWRNRPLTVTLFGNGPNHQTLESLRQLWNLQNVSFGGFVSNIVEIWASHHALVLPSRVEGLPLAVIEAMLCGRPCIVTDVAGNSEVIEDNNTGFIAAAPTPRLLDEAMERAWAQRDTWQAMGYRASRKIRELVPPDPVQVFANELMDMLAEAKDNAEKL